MQKKLIALAVAGLVSGAAFADGSNVQLYGVVDMYYGHGSATNAQGQTAINSGGLATSRIGFTGNEDLGAGNKVVFDLEYALNVAGDTLGGAATARKQYVGFQGNFGTAIAGRLQTAGYDFSAATNALHGTVLNSVKTVGANGTLISDSSRVNNAFAYVTPNFSGFSAAYNHARLTESANTMATKKDDTANILSGTYANGPLVVTAIYGKKSIDSTAAADDVKEEGVGGSYDFKVVKLYASYQTMQTGTAAKNKAWQISGIVPVTAAGKVVAEYAANKIDSTPAADNSKAFSLAYLHSLSKRTTLYTGLEHTSNDSSASLGNSLVAPIAVAPATGGGNANLFVFGVNHAF